MKNSSFTSKFFLSVVFVCLLGVTKLIACQVPTNFYATNITYNSVNLSWTQNGGADQWAVVYGPVGFNPFIEGTLISDITVNPFLLSGLNPETTYQVYIRAVCYTTNDYSSLTGPISFTTLPFCQVPTNITYIAKTDNSVTLTWNSPGGTDLWNIQYGPYGFDLGTGTIISDISDNPYTITGLNDNTQYSFYIQADCTTETSEWSNSYSLYTTYSAILPEWIEDFQESNFPPDFWVRRSGQLANPSTFTYGFNWTRDLFAHQIGSFSAKTNPSGSGRYDWLITPSLDLGNGTTPFFLEFDIAMTCANYYGNPELNGTDDKFAVVISTNNGQTWSSANILKLWDNQGSPNVYNSLNPQALHVLIDLTSYTGLVQIGFYSQSTLTNSSNDLFIDNVEVNALPECLAPYSINAYNETLTSIDVSWSELIEAPQWEIIYGTEGFDPELNGTLIENVTTNPFTINGLNQGEIYDIYVRGDCIGGVSNWTGPAQITTIPFCSAPVDLTATDILESSVNLVWTETGSATEWEIIYDTVGFDPLVEGNIIPGITNTEYLLAGLTSAVGYDIYVRANCGGIVSWWSNKLEIITACENSFSLPLLEDFESGLGYFVNDIPNNVDWTIVSNVSFDGSNSVKNFYSHSNTNILTLLCSVDLNETENPILSFAHIGLVSNNYDYCYIETSIDGLNWSALPQDKYLGAGNYTIPTNNSLEGPCFLRSAYSAWSTSSINNGLWRKEKFSLADFIGESEVWVRFRLKSGITYSYSGWYLDEIKIYDEICPPPTNIVVSEIGKTYAELEWIGNVYAESWDIKYGLHGFNPETDGIIENFTTDTAVVYGLNPETQYDFYIITNCAGAEQNFEAEPIVITTPAICLAPTALNISNILKTEVTVNWTDSEANSCEFIYGSPGFNLETEGIFVDEINEQPYTLNGLIADTQYELYVRADCNTDGVSYWTGPVSFTTLVACFTPSEISVSEITSSSFLVSCTLEEDASEWEILFGITGFNPEIEGSLVSGIIENDYVISGLEPATSYDIYVRAVCDLNLSEWSEKILVNTDCDGLFSLPLIEDFENGLGFFKNNIANDVDWGIDTAVAYNGMNCIKNVSTDNNNNTLELRCPFDLSNAVQPYLSFESIALVEHSYDFCYVEVSTNGTDWNILPQYTYMGLGNYVSVNIPMNSISEGPCFMESSYEDWVDALPDNSLWKKEKFSLNNYIGDSEVWVRFRLHSDGSISEDGWHIDNIIIYDQICQQPIDITLFNSSFTAGIIGWTEAGTATEWEVAYGIDGYYPINSGNMANVTENQCIVSGLAPQTNYDFYVRAICSEDNQSLWSGPFSFTGNVTCSGVFGSTVINANYESLSLEINTLGTESQWNVIYGLADFIVGEGTQISITDNQFAVTGLDVDTEYDFYFQSDCGADGLSTWVGPFKHRTTALCPVVQELIFENITYESVDIDILPGSTEFVWDILYGYQGFDPLTEGVLIADNYDNPLSLSGLNPETQYSVYVIANCGSVLGISEMAGPFNFATYPLCPSVSDVSASNLECTSALISWTPGLNELDWTIEYGESGFSLGTGTTQTVTTSQVLLENLSPYTTYTVYIISNCGVTLGNSDLVSYNFKTACDTLMEFPWIEEFEDWSEITYCWDLAGGTATVAQYNDNAVVASFWYWTSGKTAYLTSPLFDKSCLYNPQIEFNWSHLYNSMYPNDSIKLQISDDNGLNWATIWSKGSSELNSFDGAQTQTPGIYVSSEPISLSDYGEYFKFRFVFISGYGPYAFIDNVTIFGGPCEMPENLLVNSISATSAAISWINNSADEVVNIYYGLSGFNPEMEGSVISGYIGNSYLFESLNSNSIYDVYIEGVCGGAHSNMVGPITFNTLPFNTETEIIAYSFGMSDVFPAEIDNVDKTVEILVANGTDLTDLVAQYSLSVGANAYISEIEQFSGVTENNFTLPVVYSIIAEDGINQTDWTIYTSVVAKIGVGELPVVLIYPNPTKGIVNFQFDFQYDSAIISVLTLNGQLLFSIKPDDRSGSFSIESLSEGMYLLRIQTSEFLMTYKLVKN